MTTDLYQFRRSWISYRPIESLVELIPDEWIITLLAKLFLKGRSDYHHPNSFHQSNPTLAQIKMFGIAAIKPNCHHFCCDT